MKAILLALLLLPGAAWADADALVAEGRHLLFVEHDVLGAKQKFEEALAEDPQHQEGNLLYAVTRLAALAYGEEFNDLLDRFGVSEEGRDLFDWTAQLPEELPPDSPTSGEVIGFLVEQVLPELEGALGNLEQVGAGFQMWLQPEEVGTEEAVEVDWGDVGMLKALLQWLRFLVYLLDSYELDLDLDELFAALEGGTFSVNGLLDQYPQLLGLLAEHHLAEAKEALGAAIDAYLAASEFIRSETDDQSDDLLTLDPEEAEQEQRLRNVLADVQGSLNGPVTIGDEELDDPFVLDLTQLFDDPLDLRSHLPQFGEDNLPVACTFPDPTFSGLLPEFTQDELNRRLHLRVPLSGALECPGWEGGAILVLALDEPDLRWGEVLGTAELEAPGPYQLPAPCGTEVYVFGLWDRDGDGRPSPGDRWGAYDADGDGEPDPVEVTSVDCQGPSGIDLELTQTLTGVEGTVTSCGQPLAGVWVEAWSDSCWEGQWLASAITDEQGHYALCLPEGVSQCYVCVGGTWWSEGGGTVDCEEADAVQLDPTGRAVADFVLGCICGTVTDPEGNPLEGIWVYASEYDTGQWAGSAQTGPDGTYCIQGLPTGTYRVKAETWGTPYVPEYYDDKPTWEEADPVPVTAPEATAGIDFQLALGGSICGTVTDPEGNPLEGIYVEAYGYDTGDWAGYAYTGPDGTYCIQRLPTGTYRVKAETWGTPYVPEYYDDKPTWEEADPVPVTAPEATAGIDFQLAERSPADCDWDGDVDGSDLQAFSAYYEAQDPRADLNGDGQVTIDDLAAFAGSFGSTAW